MLGKINVWTVGASCVALFAIRLYYAHRDDDQTKRNTQTPPASSVAYDTHEDVSDAEQMVLTRIFHEHREVFGYMC